ncbi:MAG: hypothetical protein AB7S38_15395 [Vulcanimicrobiota bacterium]
MRWTALMLLIALAGPSLAECRLDRATRVRYLGEAARMLRPLPSGEQVLRVVAHRYFNHYEQKYYSVTSVEIHEKTTQASSTSTDNPGALYSVEARLEGAAMGRYYQVRVEWEDGSTFIWDYRMERGAKLINVTEPN